MAGNEAFASAKEAVAGTLAAPSEPSAEGLTEILSGLHDKVVSEAQSTAVMVMERVIALVGQREGVLARAEVPPAETDPPGLLGGMEKCLHQIASSLEDIRRAIARL
jgi:hypothetical protein